MSTEAILAQTLEQLDLINQTLAALRKDYLPSQPRKFAILAEGPLEELRRLHSEVERLSAGLAVAGNSD